MGTWGLSVCVCVGGGGEDYGTKVDVVPYSITIVRAYSVFI